MAWQFKEAASAVTPRRQRSDVAVGGVQAVAAMVLGTETIGKVDLLARPGNAYVAEAKRQLSGEVGIDLFASPTEILVVADDAADPFVVAVDRLSQAEHGPDSPAVLITTSMEVGRAAMAHIDRLLPEMPTVDMAGPAGHDHRQVHVVDGIDEAYRLADAFASETTRADPHRVASARAGVSGSASTCGPSPTRRSPTARPAPRWSRCTAGWRGSSCSRGTHRPATSGRRSTPGRRFRGPRASM